MLRLRWRPPHRPCHTVAPGGALSLPLPLALLTAWPAALPASHSCRRAISSSSSSSHDHSSDSGLASDSISNAVMDEDAVLSAALRAPPPPAAADEEAPAQDAFGFSARAVGQARVGDGGEMHRWRAVRQQVAEFALYSSHELDLLLFRALRLHRESAAIYARRGRIHPRGQKDDVVHSERARHHARQCNALVRQILRAERESLEAGVMNADAAEPAPNAETDALAEPAARQPDAPLKPFRLQKGYFLLLMLLRSLPAELVEEDVLHQLWAQMSMAHLRLADYPKRNRRFAPFLPSSGLCGMLLDLLSSSGRFDLLWNVWRWMRQQQVPLHLIAINTVLAAIRRHILTARDSSPRDRRLATRNQEWHPALERIEHAHMLYHLHAQREWRARFVDVWRVWEAVCNESAAQPQIQPTLQLEAAAAASGDLQPSEPDAPPTDTNSVTNSIEQEFFRSVGMEDIDRSSSAAAPPPEEIEVTPLLLALRAETRPRIESSTFAADEPRPSLASDDAADRFLASSAAPTVPPPALVLHLSNAYRDAAFQMEVLRFLSHCCLPFHVAHWVSEIMVRSGADVGQKRQAFLSGGDADEDLAEEFANMHVLSYWLSALEGAIHVSDAAKLIRRRREDGKWEEDGNTEKMSTHPPSPLLLDTLLAAAPIYSRPELLRLAHAFWRVLTEQLRVRPDEKYFAQYLRLLAHLGDSHGALAAFDSQRLSAQRSPLFSAARMSHLLRQGKFDSHKGAHGNRLIRDHVSVYTSVIQALRHVVRRPELYPSIGQNAERLKHQQKQHPSVDHEGEQDGGQEMHLLPPSLLHSLPDHPVAHFLRTHVLSPLLETPPVMDALNPRFFIQLFLLLEEIHVAEATQRPRTQADEDNLMFDTQDVAHDTDDAADDGANRASGTPNAMWHLFTHLRRVSQLPLVRDTKDVVTLARHALCFESCIIILRNFQYMYGPAPGQMYIHSQLRGAESILDCCHRSAEAEFRKSAAGRRSRSDAFEAISAMRDMRQPSIEAVTGRGPHSAWLPSEYAFADVVHAALAVAARIPSHTAARWLQQQFQYFFGWHGQADTLWRFLPESQLDSSASLQVTRDRLHSPRLMATSKSFDPVLELHVRRGAANFLPQLLRLMKDVWNVSPSAGTFEILMNVVAQRVRQTEAEGRDGEGEAKFHPQSQKRIRERQRLGEVALLLYRWQQPYRRTEGSWSASPALYASLLHCVAGLSPLEHISIDSARSRILPSAVVLALLREMQHQESSLRGSGEGHFLVRVHHWESLFLAYARLALADAAHAPTMLSKSLLLLDLLWSHEKSHKSGGSSSKSLASNETIYESVRAMIIRCNAIKHGSDSDGGGSLASNPTVSACAAFPPLIPGLLSHFRSFAAHSNTGAAQQRSLLSTWSMQLLRDCLGEFQRLRAAQEAAQGAGHTEQARAIQVEIHVSSSNFVSVWNAGFDLAHDSAAGRSILTPAHYAMIIHLLTFWPPSPPGSLDSSAWQSACWSSVWRAFGQSQLTGVIPSPRLVLSMMRCMFHFGQVEAAWQLYSNMLRMTPAIAIPSNAHGLLWDSLEHQARTAGPISGKQRDADLLRVAKMMVHPEEEQTTQQQQQSDDVSGDAAAAADELLQTPFIAARALFHQHKAQRTPLMFWQLFKVLRWQRVSETVTEKPAASEKDLDEDEDEDEDEDDHVASSSRAVESPMLSQARSLSSVPLVLTADELAKYWARSLVKAGIYPEAKRAAFIDLTPMDQWWPVLKEGVELTEEERLTHDARRTLATSSSSAATALAPVAPSLPPSMRECARAHVDAVLQCALHSLVLRKRTFPHKHLGSLLVRVAGLENDTAIQQAAAKQGEAPKPDVASLAEECLSSLSPSLSFQRLQLSAAQVQAMSAPHAATSTASAAAEDATYHAAGTFLVVSEADLASWLEQRAQHQPDTQTQEQPSQTHQAAAEPALQGEQQMRA